MNIKLAFSFLDNHLDKRFDKYFKGVAVDYFVQILINSVNNGLTRRRRLQSNNNLNYELIVEDKYGKKYKYSGDKDEPEVIEYGMQGDKEYGANHYSDNVDFVDDSKMTLINYKLLLLLTSLIFI